jgi:hypothetical protein
MDLWSEVDQGFRSEQLLNLRRQIIVSVRIIAKRKARNTKGDYRHDNHKIENRRLPDDISF